MCVTKCLSFISISLSLCLCVCVCVCVWACILICSRPVCRQQLLLISVFAITTELCCLGVEINTALSAVTSQLLVLALFASHFSFTSPFLPSFLISLYLSSPLFPLLPFSSMERLSGWIEY